MQRNMRLSHQQRTSPRGQLRRFLFGPLLAGFGTGAAALRSACLQLPASCCCTCSRSTTHGDFREGVGGGTAHHRRLCCHVCGCSPSGVGFLRSRPAAPIRSQRQTDIEQVSCRIRCRERGAKVSDLQQAGPPVCFTPCIDGDDSIVANRRLHDRRCTGWIPNEPAEWSLPCFKPDCIQKLRRAESCNGRGARP